MQRLTSTTPACAPCKHQRKKCTETCLLAPFFPPEKTCEFQAVHKVFGVSNVTKLIANVKEEDRKRVVDSLVWEASCRQKDPVLGPYGDYKRVCEELRVYKSQNHQQQMHHQLPTHLHQVYKPGLTQGMMNTNNMHENSYYSSGYSSYHLQDQTQRLTTENSSITNIPHQQQFLANSFNQPYFVTTGQYNPLDAKSMESTIWEASSS